MVRLLKRLIKAYFSLKELKYVLPDDIRIKIINDTIHNLIKISAYDNFDLGNEKNLDFDNSINSFVGCCSFGTGHRKSFIIVKLGKI